MIFAIAMTAILLAPIIFNRLRLPDIVGLILAGVILGPNATNILAESESIRLLGTVGLLYIMFIAGLDIDLGQFFKQKNRSLTFGILTFAIPQIVGTLVFRAMDFSWPASILIASMFASHTLVAYPIVRRLGIAKNDAVATAVGGTIFTDTLALLLLAVVARSTQGELTAGFWLTLAISFSLYILAVFAIIPRLGRWFFRKVQDRGRAEFVFVLAIVFLCSWAALAIGTEPIIGAFLAGLALNRLVPESSPLMSRIQFFGDGFIIPFFLLYIGMLVDFSVLFSSITAWIVMGTMLAINIGTKYIASMTTARIFKYSKDQAMVIFGLSTCEAAATLAATLVGLELGIIGEEVLNGVIMLIFVTCIMGPWLVEKFGAKVALHQKEAPLKPNDIPQRILVPLANPNTSDSLMDLALMLRGNSEVPIYPLTVVPNGSLKMVTNSEQMLQRAVAHATSANVPVSPMTRIDLNIAKGVSRAVQERRITDVVIGWNGKPSASDRVFGSVLDQTLAQIPQQLIVAKLEHPINTITNLVLLVPSSLAQNKEDFAIIINKVKTLANEIGAELNVVLERDYAERIYPVVESTNPQCKTTLIEVEEWDDLETGLKSTDERKTMLVLVGIRPGKYGGNTGQKSLLKRIAVKIPNSNFITIFTSTEKEIHEQSLWLAN